ncbi:hypothetical protein [Pelomonas sp. KK5]|uniref:hypothetical protein n=1 Tax=Pelomonas sp. KK5 TaxID=1855730 RepID=UPI00097C2D9C|nr:hypothetical protein [Pelomonas sp. KK5]
MSRLLRIVVAIAALFAAGALGGWKGVVLVMAVLIVILLVQFWQLMKLMGMAQKGPVGRVADAAALGAKLREGMKLVDVLPLAGSLGEAIEGGYRWTDAGGARVDVALRDGRITGWTAHAAP